MSKIEKANVEDIMALSPQQLGMLLLYLRDKKSDLNLEQMSINITGEIESDIFIKSWEDVVQNNEMLRTLFRWENVQTPVQIILKNYKPTVVFFDLSNEDKADSMVDMLLENDIKTQFDLGHVPFRVKLIKISNTVYKMILSNHHILFDGWSTAILLSEFFYTYNCLAKNTPTVHIQKNRYKEYIKFIQSQNQYRHNEFWDNYLKEYSCERSYGEKCDNSVELYNFKIEKQVQEEIKLFLRKNNLTLSALVYCTWAILLKLLYGKNDIVFDTTTSTRTDRIKGIQNIVGLFINTLPIRIKLNEDSVLERLLANIYDNLQQQLDYTYLPIKYCNRNEGYLNSLVVIENYPLGELLLKTMETISFRKFEIVQNTGYNITVIVMPFEELEILVFYNKSLCDSVKSISLLFSDIIREIISNSDLRVEDIVKNKNYSGKIKVTRSNSPIIKKNRDDILSETEENLLDIWAEVLNIDKIAIQKQSNFFELSGHSLDAITLVAKIYKSLNVKVPLTKVFELATLSELAIYIEEANKSEFCIIKKAEEKDYYLTSSAQKRIYIAQQIDTQCTAYNVSAAFRVTGSLNIEELTNVFRKLIERHEVFRTTFIEVDDNIYQKLHCYAYFDIESIDNHIAVDKKIKPFIKPFELSKAPLLRVGLIHIDDNEHILIVDMHHIISDGVSTAILISEMLSLYEGKSLRPLKYQYKDYSEWHNRMADEIKPQEEYWVREFASEIPALNLPLDFKRTDTFDYVGECITFSIHKEQAKIMKEIALQKGTTLFAVLLSFYFILLHKLSRDECIIVGIPVANRSNADTEHIVGMFVNMLPIKIDFHSISSFYDLLVQVKNKLLVAFENQDYQFEMLVEALKINRERSRHPIFDVVFLFQNIRIPKMELPNLVIEPYLFAKGTAKFDLMFTGTEVEDTIQFEVEYKTVLFKKDTINYFISYYTNIVKTLLNKPYTSLSSLQFECEDTNKYSENLEGDY